MISGVGNGDGSDLSIELRVDGLLIFECRVGPKINCEVNGFYTLIQTFNSPRDEPGFAPFPTMCSIQWISITMAL